MSRDLFSPAAPLPERLRPDRMSDFQGQSDLVQRLQKAPLHSMILYGPPGCGKTTLARLLARNSGRPFHLLSAVSCGIKEVREIIDKGRQGGGVILFLDEIHRFNKSQQDALLHAVEDGSVLLIGATTENPSFEVIGPLLSRCQVYRLKALDEEQLEAILERGLSECERVAGRPIDRALFREHVREPLLEAAGGDARKMLRFLELLVEEARSSEKAGAQHDDSAASITAIAISEEHVKSVLSGRVRLYDRQGENHFDYVSAFIKSLRGSDPDAALLYLAVMIEGGEDPLFIARRMIIFASEDIGNASPTALTMAVSTFQALERIGMPEGRIILGQCATFLAASPKSNASYVAINDALARVSGRRIPVPDHLRNAPTATHRAEGAGRGYQYPHDYPAHFVEENYFPEGEKRQFYRASRQGQEARIADRLQYLFPDRRYPAAPKAPPASSPGLDASSADEKSAADE
jgi:putative ATPase